MVNQTLGTLCSQGGAEKGLPGVSWDIPGAQGGGGSLSVGSIPLCFVSCRKKMKEREKGTGGAAVGEDRVEKKHQKSRVNLLTSPDSAAPLVISVGYRGCQRRL